MLWRTGKSCRDGIFTSLLLVWRWASPWREISHPAGSTDGRWPRCLAVLGLGLVPVIGSPSWALDASAPAEPADLRVLGGNSQALIAALRSRILAAHSATLALEGWCADYKLAGEPRLVAERIPIADKPLTPAQRARLAIGPDEPVRYRRVRLACGDRVLSEADNWYVPARLTPEMNATLDGTRTPFGRVVRPLSPVRSTIDVRAPVQQADPGPDDPLFEVDAVLSTGAGQPFCEVIETYLGGALPRASR